MPGMAFANQVKQTLAEIISGLPAMSGPRQQSRYVTIKAFSYSTINMDDFCRTRKQNAIFLPKNNPHSPEYRKTELSSAPAADKNGFPLIRVVLYFAISLT